MKPEQTTEEKTSPEDLPEDLPEDMEDHNCELFTVGTTISEVEELLTERQKFIDEGNTSTGPLDRKIKKKVQGLEELHWNLAVELVNIAICREEIEKRKTPNDPGIQEIKDYTQPLYIILNKLKELLSKTPDKLRISRQKVQKLVQANRMKMPCDFQTKQGNQ